MTDHVSRLYTVQCIGPCCIARLMAVAARDSEVPSSQTTVCQGCWNMSTFNTPGTEQAHTLLTTFIDGNENVVITLVHVSVG